MSALIGHGHELSPQVIARKTEADMWFRSPWGRFIADIVNDPDRPMDALNRSTELDSKPIIKFTEFSSEGTDTIFVPQIRRLTGEGILGDIQLEGTEENLAVYRAPVYVNAIAHAVNTSIGVMNDLRSKRIAQLREAAPALRRWFSDRLSWNVITNAFYRGFSTNILALAADGGLGIAERHHPNFYIANSSNEIGAADVTENWVNWSGTAGTYLARIRTALAIIDDAVTDARSFSADLLEMLRPALVGRRIAPLVTKNGKEFWYLMVHPDVMSQARQDTRLVTATERAFTGRGMEDVILTGGELVYNGFVIVESIVGGVEINHAATPAVFYGPVDDVPAYLNWLTNYRSSVAARRLLKASLVLGSGALGIGQLNRLKMVPGDSTDYQRKGSVGATLITGASLLTYYDNIVTPTLSDNRGSAVIVTHSPPIS